jgi:hypothetical protein
VQWQQPTRLRNRVVRGYWSIDIEILHTMANEQVPKFSDDGEARPEAQPETRAAERPALTSSVTRCSLSSGLGRGYTGGLSPMSTSPLSPQEIRAAAEAHKELGPEYSDAVIESFLERVDREIAARVDARLEPVSRARPVPPAQPNSRRALLTGVGIGILIAGVPSMLVVASATRTIVSDEKQVLLVIAIFWVIAVAIGAFASRIPVELRRKEYGVRRTGRQTP